MPAIIFLLPKRRYGCSGSLWLQSSCCWHCIHGGDMISQYHWRTFYLDFCEAVEKFDFSDRRFKLGLKTALSCIAAVSLTLFLRIDHAYWAGISVLIVTMPHISAEMWKGWQRMGGACIGSLLGLFFADLVVQSATAFNVYTFILLTVGFYLNVRCTRTGYFWLYGTFHVYMITILVLSGEASAAEAAINGAVNTSPEQMAFDRGAAVSIGVIVSTIINLLFWPDFAYDDAKKELMNFGARLSDFAAEMVRQYLRSDYNPERFNEKQNELKKALAAYKSLYAAGKLDQKIFYEDKLPLSDFQTDRLEILLDSLSLLYRRLAESGDKFHYQHNFAAQLNKLPSLLQRAVSGNDSALKTEADQLFEQLNHSPGEKQKRKYDVEELILYRNFIDDFHKLLRIITLTELHPDTTAREENPEDLHYPSLSLTINWPTLKYAMKAAGTILALFWIWLWFEVPGGGTSLSISVLAVFQTSMFTTEQKSVLRFLGCAIGAAVGLTVLWWGVESWFIMCVIMLVVITITGYIWGSRPGVAYAGLQAGIAFLVCAICGDQPSNDIESGIHRLVSILIAIICIWIVNHIIFPTDFIATVREGILQMRRRLTAQAKFLGEELDSPGRQWTFATLNPEEIMNIVKSMEERYLLSNEDATAFRQELLTLKQISNNFRHIHALLQDQECYIDRKSWQKLINIAGPILMETQDDHAAKMIQEMKAAQKSDAAMISREKMLHGLPLEKKLVYSGRYRYFLDLADLLTTLTDITDTNSTKSHLNNT